MRLINEWGRQWDELDALKATVHLGPEAFTLVSEDGYPLCGICIDGQKPVELIARGWRAE